MALLMLGCVPGNKLSSSLATPELLLGSVLTEIRGQEKKKSCIFSLCKIVLNVFRGGKVLQEQDSPPLPAEGGRG